MKFLIFYTKFRNAANGKYRFNLREYKFVYICADQEMQKCSVTFRKIRTHC